MICAKCVVYLLINKHLLSLLGTRHWAKQEGYRDERDPASFLSTGPVGRISSLTSHGHNRGKKLRYLMVAPSRCQAKYLG